MYTKSKKKTQNTTLLTGDQTWLTGKVFDVLEVLVLGLNSMENKKKYYEVL